MQDDVEPDTCSWYAAHGSRQFLHARGTLLFSLLIAGCGGGGDGTPRVVSSPTLVTAPQQAASGPARMPAQDASPSKKAKSLPQGVRDDPAVRLLESPSLAQLSALPHLSALSAREKAGLLVQLPGKSSSERLALINMYPSLAQLPVQQKEVLLDKLEKIVPITPSQPR